MDNYIFCIKCIILFRPFRIISKFYIDHVVVESVGDQINAGTTPSANEDLNQTATSSTYHDGRTKDKRTINKLRTKISRMKQQIKLLKSKEDNVDHERIISKLSKMGMPKHVTSFITAQIRANASKSKQQGRRWNAESKKMALSVYYHSRKAYNVLSKLFTLPHKSTLRRVIRKSKIYPGFHEQIFRALEYRVASMAENQRDCILCFDEMSIKSGLRYDAAHDSIEGVEDYCHLGRSKTLASHALVFMVRGLGVKWKQAVGYFLSSGAAPSSTISSLIEDCIGRLKKSGFTSTSVHF